MLKYFLQLLFFINFLFLVNYSQVAFAEIEVSGDNVAICRISGGSEKVNKRIKSTENTILINSSKGTAIFAFETSSKLDGEDISLTISAQVTETNLDTLNSSKIVKSVNDKSQFILIKSKGDEDIQIQNLTKDKDGTQINSQILIQFTNYNSVKNLASGNLKIRFPETIATHGDEETGNSNGKMVVTCKFSNVPVSVK